MHQSRACAAWFAAWAMLFGAFAPGARADDDLTLANLNILHGLGCAPDLCRVPDRIDLLFDWIADAGCPDVVTLQEVNDLPAQAHQSRALIEAELATACGGQYDGNSVYSDVQDIDEEMLLSRYPILSSEVLVLHSGLAPNFTRHVLYAEIDHPAGAMDVFTTHLSSGSDQATNPCSPCPAACTAAGATTNRECQAVQLADYVNLKNDTATPAFVTGDLNAEPGSFEYEHLVAQGWSDTHLAVGNAECDPLTTGAAGCTSGRESGDPSELESTADNVDRRIDYAFLVRASPSSSLCVRLDGAGDLDGDGTATRVFADVSNPFAACGASPSAICWPSDHEGNEVDANLGCAVVPTSPLAGYALLAGLLLAFAVALTRRGLLRSS
ncbi:MAG: hypothetical protein HKP30_00470 [Myxococcales bacterium]|nr:hypothetical protein [Myxococcales bacterium]